VTGVFRYSAQDHSGLGPQDAAMIKWDGRRFVPAG
jgi:branched-chain amino acid transport system substrate-binding protein